VVCIFQADGIFDKLKVKWLDPGKVDNNALKFGTLWNGWNALERLERAGTIREIFPGVPAKIALSRYYETL